MEASSRELLLYLPKRYKVIDSDKCVAKRSMYEFY